MADRFRSYQEAMFWDYDLIDWCDHKYINKTNKHQMSDVRLNEVDNEVNYWQESPYEYQVGTSHKEMVLLCTKEFNETQVEWFDFFSEYRFTYRMYLDDLPSATVIKRNKSTHKREVQYHEGVPVGFWNDTTGKSSLVNHLEITVLL